MLITTKRGKAGEAKFTYDGMLAVQRQTKRLDMMNLREFASFYNDFVETGELEPSSTYADPSLLGVNQLAGCCIPYCFAASASDFGSRRYG